MDRIDLATNPAKVDQALQTLTQDGGGYSSLKALVEAAYCYEESGDVRVLQQAARDVIATVEARTLPGFDKALARAPHVPHGTVRPVSEVLAAHRR
jgi:hypothetical protein